MMELSRLWEVLNSGALCDIIMGLFPQLWVSVPVGFEPATVLLRSGSLVEISVGSSDLVSAAARKPEWSGLEPPTRPEQLHALGLSLILTAAFKGYCSWNIVLQRLSRPCSYTLSTFQVYTPQCHDKQTLGVISHDVIDRAVS